MAKRARGFGMRVLYHDVHRATPEEEEALGARSAEMDTLLAESDFVTLHTNLTPETHHLLDAAAFSRMKPGAVVINTSRGPVIDHDALYDALASGRLFGAGLDVTDPEPLPADHPILTLENVVVCPHIASASLQTRTKMAILAAENIVAVLAGERPKTPVNPEIL
jgi:glyoxylate reductase